MYLVSSENNKLYNDYDRRRKHREVSKRLGTGRDDFERDYGRIIHSSAFRRLQGKTQVFGPAEGDFHRTRLTHTLEVSQIARSIAIHLNETDEIITSNSNYWIDISLIESAALAHDLGHPPYGHQGERALNRCVLAETNNQSGFEGNAHTVRLLTKLEGSDTKKLGLNLTRGTLLSVIKYPIVFNDANSKEIKQGPPKASFFSEENDVYEWLVETFTDKEKDYFTDICRNTSTTGHKKTKHKTLECSIMEIADDIAYATHDLQDVLKFNLLNIQALKEEISGLDTDNPKFEKIKQSIKNIEENSSDGWDEINEVIKKIIDLLITEIFLVENNDTDNNRLKYTAKLSRDGRSLIDLLSDQLIYEKVIKSQRVQTMEYKGTHIITSLYEAFYDSVDLLPVKEREKIEENGDCRARIVADYIAGMTDQYAENFYRRLYESDSGRLFDI